MPFSKRLSLLPAFLTLTALWAALPAPADMPAPPAATSQTITLQHVVPGDLLKSLHWDKAADLPAGVTQITALPASNSLTVIATPDGLAQVQEIIALADVAPRQVKVEFALAGLTDADVKASGIPFDLIPLPDAAGKVRSEMKYAAGAKVTAFLRTLQTRQLCPPFSTVTTTNNVDTSLKLSFFPTLPNLEMLNFAFTPRIGDDGADILALHPLATWRVPGKLDADGTPATSTEGLRSERGVRDGDTLVFINLFAGAAGTGKQLALFVRPTALPK